MATKSPPNVRVRTLMLIRVLATGELIPGEQEVTMNKPTAERAAKLGLVEILGPDVPQKKEEVE